VTVWLHEGDVILRLQPHEAEALAALFAGFPKGKAIEEPLRQVLDARARGAMNTTEASPLVERETP